MTYYLDKITLDFVTQMSKYIARVNNRIIKTLDEIEKEEMEIIPVTPTTVFKEQQQEEGIKLQRWVEERSFNMIELNNNNTVNHSTN